MNFLRTQHEQNKAQRVIYSVEQWIENHNDVFWNEDLVQQNCKTVFPEILHCKILRHTKNKNSEKLDKLSQKLELVDCKAVCQDLFYLTRKYIQILHSLPQILSIQTSYGPLPSFVGIENTQNLCLAAFYIYRDRVALRVLQLSVPVFWRSIASQKHRTLNSGIPVRLCLVSRFQQVVLLTKPGRHLTSFLPR